jgi:hypothetical protein
MLRIHLPIMERGIKGVRLISNFKKKTKRLGADHPRY